MFNSKSNTESVHFTNTLFTYTFLNLQSRPDTLFYATRSFDSMLYRIFPPVKIFFLVLDPSNLWLGFWIGLAKSKLCFWSD